MFKLVAGVGVVARCSERDGESGEFLSLAVVVLLLWIPLQRWCVGQWYLFMWCLYFEEVEVCSHFVLCCVAG